MLPICPTARLLLPPLSAPISAVAFEEKSAGAAWKTVPSWYVIATDDQVIPAVAQRFMAQRAGSHATEIHASHAVALTHPAAVAEQIAAASAVHRPSPARPPGPKQPER